jgi:hypothetical protein
MDGSGHLPLADRLGDLLRIGIGAGLSVDQQNLIAQLHRVARQGDQTLDQAHAIFR